jgi:uncharacterized protein DUF4131
VGHRGRGHRVLHSGVFAAAAKDISHRGHDRHDGGGFAVATWKTARVAHGVLARPMYSVSLSGFVETRDIRERTDRFVLRVAQMESPRGQIKLERVRLSVRKGTAPAVGSFVELKARLQPPLAPLRPGSYDFGRDMYFAGIGASGFVTGAPVNDAMFIFRARPRAVDFRISGSELSQHYSGSIIIHNYRGLFEKGT